MGKVPCLVLQLRNTFYPSQESEASNLDNSTALFARTLQNLRTTSLLPLALLLHQQIHRPTNQPDRISMKLPRDLLLLLDESLPAISRHLRIPVLHPFVQLSNRWAIGVHEAAAWKPFSCIDIFDDEAEVSEELGFFGVLRLGLIFLVDGVGFGRLDGAALVLLLLAGHDRHESFDGIDARYR